MAFGRICHLAGGAICTSCPRSCRLDDQRRNAKTVAHRIKTASYQRKRKAALDRDGRRCRLGLPGCTGEATTVHLRAELAGDHERATLDDLTSCCAHCHGVVDGRRAR